MNGIRPLHFALALCLGLAAPVALADTDMDGTGHSNSPETGQVPGNANGPEEGADAGDGSGSDTGASLGKSNESTGGQGGTDTSQTGGDGTDRGPGKNIIGTSPDGETGSNGPADVNGGAGGG